MNEKQVVFKCRTCEHRNRMLLGTKNFVPYQIEYEALTDAWQHIKETMRDENPHDIIAVLEEEK